MTKHIKVWEFESAPKKYKFSHGGDEDWVAFIPDGMNYPMDWFNEGGSFGCCGISEHKVKGGTVFVGAHA